MENENQQSTWRASDYSSDTEFDNISHDMIYRNTDDLAEPVLSTENLEILVSHRKSKPGTKKVPTNSDEAFVLERQALRMKKSRGVKALMKYAYKLKKEQTIEPVEVFVVVMESSGKIKYGGSDRLTKRFEDGFSLTEGQPNKSKLSVYSENSLFPEKENLPDMPVLTPNRYSFPFNVGSGKTLAAAQKERLENIRISIEKENSDILSVPHEIPKPKAKKRLILSKTSSARGRGRGRSGKAQGKTTNITRKEVPELNIDPQTTENDNPDTVTPTEITELTTFLPFAADRCNETIQIQPLIRVETKSLETETTMENTEHQTTLITDNKHHNTDTPTAIITPSPSLMTVQTEMQTANSDPHTTILDVMDDRYNETADTEPQTTINTLPDNVETKAKKETPSTLIMEGSNTDMRPGQVVAVAYEDTFYVGNILEEKQKTTKIKFMQWKGKQLIWPRRDDIEVVKKHFILGNVDICVATRSGRTFNLCNPDMIDRSYKIYKDLNF